MGSHFFWIRIILITIVALVVLLYATGMLIGAFQLENPLEFIMLFFSASLVIMVSLVGLLYSAFQVHNRYKKQKKDSSDGL